MSAWIDQIFDRKQVAQGNAVRRALRDVQKYASLDQLIEEVKARDFHLVQVGEQVIVLCNKGDITLLC
jgi:hypothetical protein